MLFWEAIHGGLALLSADAKSDAYTPNGLTVIH
jgi:hypothetical protein